MFAIVAKYLKLHKFQLLIAIFEKSIIPDMHHRITYMYINFQQIRIVDQSKPCTHILASSRKLHKFATTNSIFFKND